MKITFYIILLAVFIVFSSCIDRPGNNFTDAGKSPLILPDYTDLTIPVNVAPMNFQVQETGEAFQVVVIENKEEKLKVGSKDGIIRFSERKWKKLLKEAVGKEIVFQVFVKENGQWKKYKSITNRVSDSPLPPFLLYRQLFPGYESWKEMSIMQRSLESFEEEPVIQNSVAEENCVNCHAVNSKNPSDFMFHVRGSLGGTFFVKDGDLQKFNLKTSEMENGATYPRWHPSGKFVAFSSNKVVQQFHSAENKKIEVSDLASSLLLYNVNDNQIKPVVFENGNQFMDTYPEWSPDGKYLYFCRAPQIEKNYEYSDIRYNIYRVAFNENNQTFGNVELVFDAAANGKSASFPRISPDGKQMVFTLHDYGCFPIWHKEADLQSINLSDFSVQPMKVNSDFTESYHSWSANGRWLVFSSKRDDGRSARPYIAFVDENGVAQKPFILPQEDPQFYSRFLKTYNIPEFSESDFAFSPGTLRKAVREKAKQASWKNQ